MILLATVTVQGMQKPEAPGLPLTQANLELLNQAHQDVSPMDIDGDENSSSYTSTKSAVSLSPEEEAQFLAQLAALDVDNLATH